MSQFFIDCYHLDGAPNWKEVAAQGYKGAFLKLSDGTQDWRTWAGAQAESARRAGLAIGFYHWLQPMVSTEAQIRTFLDAGLQPDAEMGWALDIEPTLSGGRDAWERLALLGRSQPASKVDDALASIGRRSKLQVSVYTTDSFWSSLVWQPSNSAVRASLQSRLNGVRAWVARYPFERDVSWGERYAPFRPKALPGFAGTPWAWQFTEKGSVEGFGGECDLSVVLD